MKFFETSRVLVVAAMAVVLATAANAQVQSTTETKEGQGTKQTTVERGEVVYVSGNELIVKMEDGQTRVFSNVPESARVEVNGQQLGIHDLKVGMKLSRTITTTTTPRMVTTVQTVTGKVWHVTPPNTVILTMENGKNQQFNIPKDQKFNVDGQMVDAFGLKKGMNISATKVVEVPENVVTQERKITGVMPPPPPPIPANQPILVVIAPHTPKPEAAAPVQTASAAPAPEPAPSKLPKTGSNVPLVGLLGLASLLLAGGMRLVRATRTN